MAFSWQDCVNKIDGSVRHKVDRVQTNAYVNSFSWELAQVPQDLLQSLHSPEPRSYGIPSIFHFLKSPKSYQVSENKTPAHVLKRTVHRQTWQVLAKSVNFSWFAASLPISLLSILRKYLASVLYPCYWVKNYKDLPQILAPSVQIPRQEHKNYCK
jgi:hypothetical protein